MNDLSYTAKVFKTVWVSDVHLGTKGWRAKEFLEFLKTIECEKIFLVGDIVDGWQLSKRWYWPQTHNDVVQKILEKATLTIQDFQNNQNGLKIIVTSKILNLDYKILASLKKILKTWWEEIGWIFLKNPFRR